MSDLARHEDVAGPTCAEGGTMHRTMAVGLAAAALLALPAAAGAEETPRRPAVGPAQTCSRPSTCETDAARRAHARTALRLRGEELNRLYHVYEALDRPAPAAAPDRAGGGFDWGDAGVGAGAGFGLALAAGAGALAVRRRGQARPGHP
jgi:hypothetical protein